MLRWSLGSQYMLYAMFFFSICNIGVKYLSHIPFFELIFFRSLISLVLSLAALRSKKASMFGQRKKVLVLRGIFGSIALSGFFFMVQEVPLATAVTIQYLAPIFTILIASVLLREPPTKGQLGCFLLAFVGVLVIKGFDSTISYFHLGVGLCSAFFAGLAYNVVRILKDTEDPMTIILYFPLVTIPLVAGPTYLYWVSPVGLSEWLWVLVIGVVTQIAQYYLTRSLHEEPAANTSIVSYAQIVFALIYGYLLFSETYKLSVYVGIAIIVGSILWSKKLKSQPRVESH